MAIRQGDKAQPFTLPHEPGQTVDLSEHLGKDKIVLLFFPLAFSPVCTTEMCTMRDTWESWSNLNAKVFGVSIDSPFVNKRFRDEEKIPFPLLSDFNKEVASRYGVLHEDLKGMKGVTKRAAFVIGKDGNVHYSWVTDNPGEQPNYDEVRTAVVEAP